MSNYQKFDLADGYCYILPQYLVITDHSDPTEILRRKERNTLGAFRAVLLILSIGFIATAAYMITIGRQNDGYILLGAGVFGIAISTKWRNRSNVKVIDRSQIRSIQLKKSMFNPAFFILFKDSKGKFKERLLVMKANNLPKIDAAIRILRSHHLMSERSINQQPQSNPNTESKNLKTIISEKPNSKNTQKSEPEKKITKDYNRDADGYIKNY
ncbi:MAG: hypothetical protein IPG07_15760 [Crocinitomicaceae bacterium]|jgi:hypothetical protein|nr:hypothetical protein [Crocinitomicaceae bacterium]MBK6950682.1 hypothetical protein [Crocinitomicaceae bacterium]